MILLSLQMFVVGVSGNNPPLECLLTNAGELHHGLVSSGSNRSGSPSSSSSSFLPVGTRAGAGIAGAQFGPFGLVRRHDRSLGQRCRRGRKDGCFGHNLFAYLFLYFESLNKMLKHGVDLLIYMCCT